MLRSRLVSVVISVVAVGSASGVCAQNLLVNPDVDTDLTGWDGPAVWDPADAFGSPSSGSATWINDYAAGGSTIVRQCVDISSWIEGFDFSAYVYIPSGQPGSGYTYLTVGFYSDADCATYMSAVGSGNYSGFDNWTFANVSGWTPTGAVGARVAVANQKTAPGDFQTSCDAVFFAGSTERVFGDGFESGDAADWSAVTGGTE